LHGIGVTSETGRLHAIVLGPPGPAHHNLLPEHVEAHLALKEYVARRLRIGEETLAKLAIEGPGGRVELTSPSDLRVSFETHGGDVGSLDLGPMGALYVENPQYLLFDDIVDDERIRAEYERFDRVVRCVAEHTYYVHDLVLDALHALGDDPVLEAAFFDRLVRLSPPEERHNAAATQRYFHQFGPRRLLELMLTGRDHTGHYVLQPLPNLLFTRDLAAVAGDRVVICSAAKATRRREMLLSWLVFTANPVFRDMAAAGQFAPVDMIEAQLAAERPETISIEGGDILHSGHGALLIGAGERTTPAAVIELGRRLWANGVGDIDRILLIELFHKRSAMHLDTIFTFADQTAQGFEAMVFAPFLEDGGYGLINAHIIEPKHVAKGRTPTVDDLPSVQGETLGKLLSDQLGQSMTSFKCGGSGVEDEPVEAFGWSDPEDVFYGHVPDAISAKREQWTDGANLFALAPGVVTTYARNRHSLEELGANGYEIVDVEAFCENTPLYLQEGKKAVIPIGGSELSRGRGGPRCMTMPLLRE